MKKFRGRNRYYKTMEKRINVFVPHHEADSWYNLWHWHLDNRGRSAISVKERRNHLRYYIQILEIISNSRMSKTKEFQSWIFIDQECPSCDALFIHTDNPHSEFPQKFLDINWQVTLPDWMNGLINTLEFTIGKGKSIEGNSACYIIYKKNLGLPLS